MTVAFFDFDGTISHKDSFLDFIQYTHSKSKLYTVLFRYGFSGIGYKLGLVSGHKMKELLLTHFFKNYESEKFHHLGHDYCKHQISNIIKPNALERILWHQKQGHKVVVVTASLATYIKPWCDRLGIQCIATQIQIHDLKITGKLKGKNCNGIEKVNRIKQLYDLDTIQYSYAYGNTSGDNALLSIANERFYRYF
ncbi:HAD-IB family hydrolase [Aquimarina rhabdastrellae]